MSMEMTPTQDLSTIQVEIVEIRKDLDRAMVWLAGNGDPTKGLLWITADLGRLSTVNSEALAHVSKLVEDHLKIRHWSDDRRNRWPSRLAFGVLQQVVGIGISLVLALLALGAVTAFQRGYL